MAFSMFLRTSGCQSRMFTQQAMRLATQPAITQRMISSSLPVRNIMKDTKTTPILNAIRSFRTSCVRRSAEKVEDHSRLWVIERVVSAALVPLIPLALMMPNKLFDSLLAILITAHSFWGMEAMVVEYIRVLLFGHVIPKIMMLLVYFLTATMLGGLFYLNFNDIGVSRAFWRIWKNMKSKNAK
uniref:Succinate dehydrogenase [ubiquinone] cytochrome b small subunit n=2 Tax=Bombyx TaxID=7090 RepID=A0A8R2DQ67_BOMMO|nr:succinate dehydrogenase [ubiquinone] cytochrome b small subunit, mitochondrial isoform X2 [Bombyx mori]